jgi:chemotaxis protein methyltransferase CheR
VGAAPPGLRWAGFRTVRRQGRRRLDALGLADLDAYRAYLEARPEEWAVLEALTPITISRFYRDRAVFQRLERAVLPTPAGAGRDSMVAWSAGCASGEEPYTLRAHVAQGRRRAVPGVRLEILTTDVNPAMLRRAREATYERSSLRELPMPWRERGFLRRGGRYVLRVPAPRDRPSPRASWAGPGRSIRPRAVPQPGFTSFECERQHYVVGRAGPRRQASSPKCGNYEATTARRPTRHSPGRWRAGRPCRGEGRPGTGPRRAAAPSGHARGARRSRGARDTASRSSVTRQPRLPSSNSSATSSSRRTRPSPQRLRWPPREVSRALRPGVERRFRVPQRHDHRPAAPTVDEEVSACRAVEASHEIGLPLEPFDQGVEITLIRADASVHLHAAPGTLVHPANVGSRRCRRSNRALEASTKPAAPWRPTPTGHSLLRPTTTRRVCRNG